MPKRELSVLASGYTYLEGLRWRDGRLWASDFYTEQVIAVDLEGRIEQICRVPQQPSGLGWLPDGRMLVSSMKDRKVLRREADGTLVVHADLSALTGGPINDMVVDALGRAYVGNFGFDLMAGEPVATTTVVRVDPDGSARGRRAVLSQRLLHHARRQDPDRQRDLRQSHLGIRHPGRRRPRPASRLGRLRRAAGLGRPAHVDRRLGHRS